MKRNIRLFKLKGIPITADWTLVLLGGFITVSLAFGYFPARLPGAGFEMHLTAALLSCLGLYLSVLLHELAHALIARQRGIGIEQISLSLFGQAPRYDREPATPRDSFWLAISGPLASLNLAGVAILGSLALQEVNPVLAAIMAYLGFLNGVLGLFNLLPALPLNGGRVLRALVWGATRDEAKANRWTFYGGRVTGWVLIGLGFGMAVSFSVLDGLIIGVAGWLLLNAARQAHYETLIRGGLQGVTVGQVLPLRQGRDEAMEPPPPYATLSDVLPGLLAVEPGRVVPLVENGYLVGVLNPAALRARFKPADWPQLMVGEFIERRANLLAVRPHEDLQTVIQMLASRLNSCAVVLDRWGHFLGLVYLRDLPLFLEWQRTRQELGYLSPTPPAEEAPPELAGVGSNKDVAY